MMVVAVALVRVRSDHPGVYGAMMVVEEKMALYGSDDGAKSLGNSHDCEWLQL